MRFIYWNLFTIGTVVSFIKANGSNSPGRELLAIICGAIWLVAFVVIAIFNTLDESEWPLYGMSVDEMADKIHSAATAPSRLFCRLRELFSPEKKNPNPVPRSAVD